MILIIQQHNEIRPKLWRIICQSPAYIQKLAVIMNTVILKHKIEVQCSYVLTEYDHKDLTEMSLGGGWYRSGHWSSW